MYRVFAFTMVFFSALGFLVYQQGRVIEERILNRHLIRPVSQKPLIGTHAFSIAEKTHKTIVQPANTNQGPPVFLKEHTSHFEQQLMIEIPQERRRHRILLCSCGKAPFPV